MKTIKEAWTWLIIIVLSMAIWNGCEEKKENTEEICIIEKDLLSL